MFVRGLIMAAAAMVLAIVLRQFAIHALYLDWNDNAYSSVIVALPILHLTWWWRVGAWLAIDAVAFLSPRWT